MRVIGDRVLVLLPENPAEQQQPSGLFLAHALTPATCYGRVFRVGPKVRDLEPGDCVAFPANAGDPVDVSGHACLFIRESDAVAVIPKREAVTA